MGYNPQPNFKGSNHVNSWYYFCTSKHTPELQELDKIYNGQKKTSHITNLITKTTKRENTAQ
jgi:hypothetical protein